MYSSYRYAPSSARTHLHTRTHSKRENEDGKEQDQKDRKKDSKKEVFDALPLQPLKQVYVHAHTHTHAHTHRMAKGTARQKTNKKTRARTRASHAAEAYSASPTKTTVLLKRTMLCATVSWTHCTIVAARKVDLAQLGSDAPSCAAKTGVTARNRARKRTKALPRLPAIRRGARTRKERTRKARKTSREGRRGQRNARTQAGAERKTNSEMGTQDALGNLVIEMKRPRNDIRRTLALYNTN